MIRYYPDPEGYKDKNGAPYPDWPMGTIRKELAEFLSALRDGCHRKSWGLQIESLNHGCHVGNSMHFKGLAVDFNCYRIDPVSGRNMRMFCTFEEQAALAADAANLIGYDAWIWKDDPTENPSHTHCSIHP